MNTFVRFAIPSIGKFDIFDCELCFQSPRNYFSDDNDEDDEWTFLKILLKSAKKGL